MRYFLLILLICFQFVSKNLSGQYVFINPQPGTENHPSETTITLNAGVRLDANSLSKNKVVEVIGSVSGRHEGIIKLSYDKTCIIFKPDHQFTGNERVEIKVSSGIQTMDHRRMRDTSFWFHVRQGLTTEQLSQIRLMQRSVFEEYGGHDNSSTGSEIAKIKVPDNTPEFTILTNDNPAPGSYFFAVKNATPGVPTYITIMDNDTAVQFTLPDTLGAQDWKINDNGYLTYYDFASISWIMLDSSFNVVDTFRSGNGYGIYTDPHEFRIYPDGHSLISSADYLPIDMSQVVAGGNPDAIVQGYIVQRLDQDENVVFQWRSWDHVEITDAAPTVNLTNISVDYIHGNSFEEVGFAAILLSFRHFNEVMKINAITGQTIWRWGGENNMFTFIDDIVPEQFSFQHYVRRLPNGHIMLFNNANYQSPQQSAAKEYVLDEVNKTATLVWSYVHPLVNSKYVFSRAAGSAQRLANGNTVICWGVVEDYSGDLLPSFTEVDYAGNIQFELRLDDFFNTNYRVTKHRWEICDSITDLTINKITSSSAKATWNDPHGAISYQLGYRIAGNSMWTRKYPVKEKLKLQSLLPGTTYEVYVSSYCDFQETRISPPLYSSFTTLLKEGEEPEHSFNAQIFPNPASGSFTVNIEGSEESDLSLTIFDQKGKEMFSSHLNYREDQLYSIDIRQFSSGIYLVHVSGNTVSSVLKLVVE